VPVIVSARGDGDGDDDAELSLAGEDGELSGGDGAGADVRPNHWDQTGSTMVNACVRCWCSRRQEVAVGFGQSMRFEG
jgi:hypothetical protein